MRAVARLLILLGAVAVGLYLTRARPRDVVLVYDVAVPDAQALLVEIRRGGEVVRQATIALRPGEQARHPVRLPDGDYVLAWRVYAPRGQSARGERPLEVHEDGTVALRLAP